MMVMECDLPFDSKEPFPGDEVVAPDNGEPQTVRHEGYFITTWLKLDKSWGVYIEGYIGQEEPTLAQEMEVEPGFARKDALHGAKLWLREHG